MTALHRFLRLVWIEIKRCRIGWLAIGLAVGSTIIVWGNPSPVVLWSDATREATQTFLLFSPFAAAASAWCVGRIDRSGTRGFSESLPTNSGAAELACCVAVIFWIVLAGLAFTAIQFVQAMNTATWGGPDWFLLLAAASGIPVYVGIGAIVGKYVRSIVVAPLVLAGSILTAMWITTKRPAMYGSADGTVLPMPDSSWISLLIPQLFPNEFFDQIDFSPVWRASLPHTLWYTVWIIGLGILALGIAVLIRKITPWRLAIVACAISCSGVSALTITENDWRGSTHITEFICEQSGGFDVCLHPAYQDLMDEVSTYVDRVGPNFMGLPGVPSTINQGFVARGTELAGGGFYIWNNDNLEESIAFEMFGFVTTDNSSVPQLNLSQCVVATVLTGMQNRNAHHCQAGHVDEAVQSVPYDARVTTNVSPDELRVEIQTRVESFSALTAEERNLWLTTNWKQLREGELTTADLP